ncbi:unnamed protein product (macronuclear) [Paramecium tetraurelia]|uniref:Uncharacterized protein n=1 Tax=Paramecium tetraurelia TaxID=5888 RepID=A0CGA2_PARTE|nr:uncharacterized protein GSPATT00038264001 [Paramecium tetraurelia]CAK69819.1 unnamed protein product [Paramecium tetraurelia]|eukprot:XP_001437216.1 hypothetical protein (macronuclear) [Paramecium tetraurelia strain d4-2]
MNRTPSHSLYMRNSRNSSHSPIPQQKFVTPEKLVRVSGSSGVKINSIQKNGTRIRSEVVETVNKVKEQQKLQEYIQELENSIYEFDKLVYIPKHNEEQEQLEKRILKLLQRNHDFELEMELVRQENEQLKQLLIEQQTKIIEQNQEIMTLKVLKDGFKKYSFSDYFKQQNQ